ncbi:CG11791 [Drosophila busckii]|uniref:CG11791 n=1 Tax=Drosophila busckii TaxID=30019 RepID=A0A0M5J0J9_DROBS|nr:CG11791 [Drosophila busckii]
MRLVRSKLRKREESETVIRTPINVSVAEQEDNTNAQDIETISTNSKDKQHVTFVRTSGAVPIATVGHTAVAEWTFPPKAPVPHIYHINQDMLMANDKITFKGFRKQFSGRFKRLVARKPEPAPVIPPELKPQLKTIYVY